MKGNLNVGKSLTHSIIIPIHDPAIKNNNSYPPRNTSISTQSLPSLLSILFVANHSYSISPPLHINTQNTMYILRSNYRVPTAKDHYFGASCLSDSPIGSKLNWKRTWLLIYICTNTHGIILSLIENIRIEFNRFHVSPTQQTRSTIEAMNRKMSPVVRFILEILEP